MQKPFTHIAILLLALVAILQLLRFVLGWEVTLNGMIIPLWASAIACVVAGALAAMLWLESRK